MDHGFTDQLYVTGFAKTHVCMCTKSILIYYTSLRYTLKIIHLLANVNWSVFLDGILLVTIHGYELDQMDHGLYGPALKNPAPSGRI